MTKDPFLSGPFEPAEVERLLRVIDERLARRAPDDAPGAVDPEAAIDPLADPALLDPVRMLTGDGLRALSAPLFGSKRGGPVARAAKALLNLPLRVFGTPQAYFNDALRTLVDAWAALLRALLDGHAVLQHELAEQRARLDRLTRAVEELREIVERLARRGPSDPAP
jgi:hypothetical protein